MSNALISALLVFVPASFIFFGSLLLHRRDRTVYSFLPALGAGFLVVLGLCHVCTALGLLPWMHWGYKGSIGSYLHFWSLVLGLTLFPVGHLFYALAKRQA